MKKFTKLLISFCMLFVLTFTLTACKEEPEDPKNTFVPPVGVDMTSPDSYANWLDNNLDETLSYTLTMDATIDGVATSGTLLKYQYKHETQRIAFYEGTEEISYYMEIFKDGRDFEVSIYDVKNKKYFTDTLSSDEYYGFDSSMFGESLNGGNIVPTSLASMRIVLGYRTYLAHMTANTYLNIDNTESVSSSSKSITNPADGKYELKTTLTSGGESGNCVFTYENNLIQSVNISNTSETRLLTYEYDDISISFDKTGYTLLENS